MVAGVPTTQGTWECCTYISAPGTQLETGRSLWLIGHSILLGKLQTSKRSYFQKYSQGLERWLTS